MFETLTETLGNFFNRLRMKGNKLTEENIREGLREVRLSLLEADVALPAVKDFINRVQEKAVGQDILKSVSPSQQIVKIVHDELIALLGGTNEGLALPTDRPAVVMMCGLQGSGKTTTAAKLALFLKNRGRRPMLVAADIQRPAAVDQLEVLGEELKVPVFADRSGATPPDICRRAVQEATSRGCDVAILDTAGRLHIDEPLMQELDAVKKAASPSEILLVCDAMTGQDAVNSAKAFNNRLGITGVILTKLDGDARGGAALSVRHVTGRPIKFVGVGEKLDRLEEFHPERMATRILGMGDVISLVEKAQQVISQEEAVKLQEKMLKETLSLEDFLNQLRTVRRMGSFKDVLAMIPGFASFKGADMDERQFAQVEAIICSMTPEERKHPEIIGASRRQRIARGSGVEPQEVSRFLREFREITRQFGSMARAVKFMGRLVPGMASTGRVLSKEERQAIKRRRKLERENRRRSRR